MVVSICLPFSYNFAVRAGDYEVGLCAYYFCCGYKRVCN